MKQKEVNLIRDKAINSSIKYMCEDILKEKGCSLKRRGIQLYTHCYKCGNAGGYIPDHFSVNISKNMYHCFGCGEGGGPAKLYSNLFNVSYIDSALTLALRLGEITEIEFKKASSSIDAIKKFSKGEGAIRKFEEVKSSSIEVKAPSNVCNIVYSNLLSLPEFKLSEEHKKYLMEVRHLTEKEIIELGFFTYHKEFNLDVFVSSILQKYRGFTYNHLYGVPGFFFEKKTRNSGVWHFKKPMPNCIGISLKNWKRELVAFQMRNMKPKSNNKYFYVSSKYESNNNPNFGYGSSSGSPVAVFYPPLLKIPTFYIGEGFFKMYEISKEGAVTFSVQGVNAISYVAEEIKRVLLNSVNSLPTTLTGKNEIKLVIVFDADMYENIQVLEAGLKASVHFSQEFPNKPISFLLWKDEYGKGFDDMKFYCQSKGIDYKTKVKVFSKDVFLDYVRASIQSSDDRYISMYGKTEDILIRRTKEYRRILYDELYNKRIKNILP